MLKTRLITPLAVACTAFMWGCQEQASSPVEPDTDIIVPIFTHGPNGNQHGGPQGGGGGDNPGSETYLYTITGDITTSPSPAGAQPSVGNDQDGSVVLQHCCGNVEPVETLTLSVALLGSVGDDAATCFGGIFPTAQFTGGMSADKKVADRVAATFLFTAKDKLGKPDVSYKLKLRGGDANATGDLIFPPEPGETVTVTFTDFSIDAQRQKEKNACSSSGKLPGGVTSVVVEGIS